MSRKIPFILNHRDVVAQESPGLLVLDYLRRIERQVGTKEGCKEGDCGACVVMIGELEDGEVVYTLATSCLVPLGELEGKHLVTIEGLNFPEDLSPVQQAIVDRGGTQCGFCTPGIVVSLTGYLMEAGVKVDMDGIKYALSGHLCRCTGYSSLKRAGEDLIKSWRGSDGENPREVAMEKGLLPEYFRDIPERLKKLETTPPPALNGDETPIIVAGGTDIYVQQGDRVPEATVHVLNRHPEMKGITRDDSSLRIGALTTFEEIGRHPEILALMPKMPYYMHITASWQIRNRATLGGNIVNASPIGDMTILFLALGAEVVLKGKGETRTVPMKDFFKAYKVLDKEPDEIVAEVVVPLTENPDKMHFEKVSKRKCLDIATVNSGIRIREKDGHLEEIGLSMGGVAPVPFYMSETCAFLKGKTLSPDVVDQALAIAQKEVTPISDVRGSADYKRLLVRQLIIGHFTTLFPEKISVEHFYTTTS